MYEITVRMKALSYTRLPHFTALHQDEIEKHMYEACIKAGVEFLWDAPVKNLHITDSGVEVTITNDEILKGASMNWM